MWQSEQFSFRLEFGKESVIIKMKKLTAILLASAIFTGIAASANYSDVKGTDWFSKAVATATEKKWFAGYDDGSFKPNNSITRAEAAKVLVTYKYGKELPEVEESKYSDFKKNEWYADFVNISGQEGIIPSDEGTFNPTEPITREDTVVGIINVLGIEQLIAETPEFTDSEEISDYAKSSVSLASANSIVSGFDDGSFGPKQPVTRAQFAQLLTNAESIKQMSDKGISAPTVQPTESTEAPIESPMPADVPDEAAKPTAVPTASPTPSPVPLTESFKEKDIYIYGDSFISTNSGWAQTVKDNLAPQSFDCKNFWSLTYSNMTTNNLVNHLSKIPAETDYLLILSGRYEWEQSRALGDEDSVQENDFTGGIRAFIKKAKATYPDMKLIILTIPNIANAKDGFTDGGLYNTKGLSIEDYSDRLKMICEEEKIDVIDLNTKCWAQNELGTYLENKNMAFVTLNEAGNEKIAEVITEELMKINEE